MSDLFTVIATLYPPSVEEANFIFKDCSFEHAKKLAGVLREAWKSNKKAEVAILKQR